eukprot:CAMPEP_0197704160 /NCGR_PEP_ID=MMETSP1338-20131121/125799_1 /TAXON_ID=43686 ORGANISM="Pelagodinium beii, Strain RCC1491" /NCGR_SAMPLE_ID=MMETSP1338 /ASSEMBLY_ACC=CAM_ASM_000754 /LENGTH=618 /DNA_ID=CAMNT_0043288059 /DNA_START=13 /DNA_END=1869 /DNA_ORIENTATION=+
MARLVVVLVLVLLGVSWGERSFASSLNVDQRPGAGAAAVMAAQRARQRREREAAERRKRAAEEKRKAEERKRKEEHRRKNMRDCVSEEIWGEWGSCSASCGGGVQTRYLSSRTVVETPDTYGYGKKCDSHSQEVQACSLEMCEVDCSHVDLGNHLPQGLGIRGSGGMRFSSLADQGNHLPATGVTKAWGFEAAEGCVFQVWQIKDEGNEKSFLLLGETLPQSNADSDPTAYDFASPADPVAIHEGLEQISLGFRSCHLKTSGSGGSATVCLPSTKSFDINRQLRSLSTLEAKYMGDYAQREMKEGKARLLSLAERKLSMSGEQFLQRGDPAATQPFYSLSVRMSPTPPPAPKLSSYYEEGDDIQLTAVSPGASGFQVFLQRQHENEGGSKSRCDFMKLLPCAEAPASSPCFTDQLLLRDLPLASSYTVYLKARNDEGLSPASTTVRFSTRALSGVPLAECEIEFWDCYSSNGALSVNGVPVGDMMQCKITASPLPPCYIPRRTNLWQTPKCEGKTYWKTCSAILKESANTCQVPAKQNVCVHMSNLGDDGTVDKSQPVAATCKSPGCSKSFLPGNQKRCCCNPGNEEVDMDMKQCACATSCEELGLVEATNPSLSCQH